VLHDSCGNADGCNRPHSLNTAKGQFHDVYLDDTSTNQRNVYRKVTDAIIKAIEQGVANWRMPWHTSGRYAFSPINVTSHKPYRGINTLCLWSAAQAKGYDSADWGTYQQWQERKAQVRKGEKSTTVVFWKFANDAKMEDGETLTSSRLLFTRGYAVFNAAQVDGYTPKAETVRPMPERIACADVFFRAIGAEVSHGGNRACYAPATDHIQMPMFDAFKMAWPTTPPSPTSTRIGPRTAPAVIGSWGNGSAIWRMLPRN
jgi:antirestriction protein ArdC